MKGEEHINNKGVVERCGADPAKPNYRGCPFDANGGHLPAGASSEQRAEFEAKAEKVAQEAAQQDSMIGQSRSKTKAEEADSDSAEVPPYSEEEQDQDVREAARPFTTRGYELSVADRDEELFNGASSIYSSAAARHGHDPDDIYEDSDLEEGQLAAGEYAALAYKEKLRNDRRSSYEDLAISTFDETSYEVDQAFRSGENVAEYLNRQSEELKEPENAETQLRRDADTALFLFNEARGDSVEDSIWEGNKHLYTAAVERRGLSADDIYRHEDLEDGQIASSQYAVEAYRARAAENPHASSEELVADAYVDTAKVIDETFKKGGYIADELRSKGKELEVNSPANSQRRADIFRALMDIKRVRENESIEAENEAIYTGASSLFTDAASRRGYDPADIYDNHELEDAQIAAGEYAEKRYQVQKDMSTWKTRDEIADDVFDSTADLIDDAFRSGKDVSGYIADRTR